MLLSDPVQLLDCVPVVLSDRVVVLLSDRVVVLLSDRVVVLLSDRDLVRVLVFTRQQEVTPSPTKPRLHRHMKPPKLFLQMAIEWQLSDPSWHSLISVCSN